MSDGLDVNHKEKLRLLNMLIFEEEAYQKGHQAIAGLDEAGRGPLAGPVVAAACILPKGIMIPLIDDSKKLIPKIREKLFDRLVSDPSIIYAVGIIESEEIDRINIYQATIQAMLQAVEKLSKRPDCLLVDGMKLPHPSLPCIKIISGDQRSKSIAAASIIAKETRDRLMRNYHKEWPLYGFDQHKGYGTPQHLEALDRYGPCAIHRHSFEPIRTRSEKEVALPN